MPLDIASFVSPLKYLKFFSLFPHLLVSKNSLTYLLYLYNYAQTTRLFYFNLCCILATMTDVTMRYFCDAYQRYWDFTFLFFPKYHIKFLYVFEALCLKVDFGQFQPNYFYDKSDDPIYIWNYKNFFLRVDFTVFGLAWKALEGIRAKTYNNYMKHHYHINKVSCLQIRRGLNEIFFRIHFNAKEYLTQRFIIGLEEFCYKIFLLTGAQVLRGRGFIPRIKGFDKSFYKKFTPFAPTLKHLVKGSSLFLLLRLRYFKRGLHIWLGWIATSILTRYGHLFKMLARWDYDHMSIAFLLLSLSPYTHGKFMSLWLAEWEERVFESVSNYSPLFFINAFVDIKALFSKEKLLKQQPYFFPGYSLRRHLLRYHPFWIKVNDRFDSQFFSFFAHPQARYACHWIFANPWVIYKHFWYAYFLKYRFFGEFHRVTINIGKYAGGVEYYHWRILNSFSVYNFLDGCLPIIYFYRRLELDYVLYYRYRLLWRFYYKYMSVRLLPLYSYHAPIQQVKPRPKRQHLINLLPLWKTYKIAIKEFNSKQKAKKRKIAAKKSLRLSFFVFYSLFLSLMLDFLASGTILPYVFFFISNQINYYHYWFKFSFRQGQMLNSCLFNQVVLRRWLLYRKGWWPHFRRILQRVGIHSLNNPFFRQNWMRYFHKMRRTGFKKQDLPYYCYEEDKDFIGELADRVRRGSQTRFFIPGYSLIDEQH